MEVNVVSFMQIAREFDEAISLASVIWQQAMRRAQERMEMQMLGVDPAEALAEKSVEEAKPDVNPTTITANMDVLTGLPVLPRGIGLPE